MTASEFPVPFFYGPSGTKRMETFSDAGIETVMPALLRDKEAGSLYDTGIRNESRIPEQASMSGAVGFDMRFEFFIGADL